MSSLQKFPELRTLTPRLLYCWLTLWMVATTVGIPMSSGASTAISQTENSEQADRQCCCASRSQRSSHCCCRSTNSCCATGTGSSPESLADQETPDSQQWNSYCGQFTEIGLLLDRQPRIESPGLMITTGPFISELIVFSGIGKSQLTSEIEVPPPKA